MWKNLIMYENLWKILDLLNKVYTTAKIKAKYLTLNSVAQ